MQHEIVKNFLDWLAPTTTKYLAEAQERIRQIRIEITQKTAAQGKTTIHGAEILDLEKEKTK